MSSSSQIFDKIMNINNDVVNVNFRCFQNDTSLLSGLDPIPTSTPSAATGGGGLLDLNPPSTTSSQPPLYNLLQQQQPLVPNAAAIAASPFSSGAQPVSSGLQAGLFTANAQPAGAVTGSKHDTWFLLSLWVTVCEWVIFIERIKKCHNFQIAVKLHLVPSIPDIFKKSGIFHHDLKMFWVWVILECIKLYYSLHVAVKQHCHIFVLPPLMYLNCRFSVSKGPKHNCNV